MEYLIRGISWSCCKLFTIDSFRVGCGLFKGHYECRSRELVPKSGSRHGVL